MLALTLANLKMMLRNRNTTFWALFFPLLLVVVFGLFEFDGFGSASLAVVDEAQTPKSQLLIQNLGELEFLRLQSEGGGEAKARASLEKGDLDYLLLIPAGFGDAQAPDTGFTPAGVKLLVNANNIKQNQLVEAAVRHLVAESLPPESLSRERAESTTPSVSPASVSIESVAVTQGFESATSGSIIWRLAR